MTRARWRSAPSSPPSDDRIEVAVRCMTRRAGRPSKDRPGDRSPPVGWPEYVLVLDTETTVDPTQRLLFGAYRLCRWCQDPDGRWRLAIDEEGLIHADDLALRNPEGMQELREYVQAHSADVASGEDPTLHLRSRREFVDEVLWHYGYRARALIVGFNLPFDLSRLATGWGKPRRRGGGHRYVGGYALRLWEFFDKHTCEWKPNPDRPLVDIKHIDRKRALIGMMGRVIPKARRRSRS